MQHPLRDETTDAAILLYLVVVLNLLFHVSQDACAAVLEIVGLLIDRDAQADIPRDVRTALRRLDMDPSKIYMAACTRCHNLEEPTLDDKGVLTYGAVCARCKARLTKWAVGRDRVAVRVPIRPYVMQSFTDFCARLYTRPGIETAIIRYREYLKASSNTYIHDINQGAGIRTFLDSKGKVFVDCEDEIRTVWSIMYDAYNPYHNKTAGKSASVGALGMACLSLPPSLRTRPENLYLAGLIPGPRQPPLEGLNPFVRPLLKTLRTSYEVGTWFTSTHNHPEGRRSREAIVPSVNDLPGANKIAGHASHSASVFCGKCHIVKHDINNLDPLSPAFRPMTAKEHRQRANEWLNADKAKRKAHFKKYGIRYSELLILEYWNPVENVVIDGMHTLFLGIVRHHFRVVIGTHWKANDEEDEHAPAPEANEGHVRKARAALHSGTATQTSMKKYSVQVLKRLCDEFCAIPTFDKGKGKHTKKPYILALIVSRSAATASYFV